MANPLAHMHKKFSFEHCSTISYLNPEIAPLLRLSDCSLISDGAAALVLTIDENALNFPKAVGIRTAVHVSEFLPMSRRDFLAFEGPERAVHLPRRLRRLV